MCTCAPLLTGKSYTQARGPEDEKTVGWGKYTARFSRLRINGSDDGGMQPFVMGNTLLMCNGEIYNHMALRDELQRRHSWRGPPEVLSDCDIILTMGLIEGFRDTVVQLVDAEFAFVAVSKDTIHVARDTHGVRPLYTGACRSCGLQNYASTPDVLLHTLESRQVPCGQLVTHPIDDPMARDVYDYRCRLRQLLPIRLPSDACVTKVFSDTIADYLTMVRADKNQVAILLSGGLDSSCVAFVAARLARERNVPVVAYTFYYNDRSPDLHYARELARELSVRHVAIHVRPTRADVVEAIHATATYCTTTVRASTLQLCGFRDIRRQMTDPSHVVFLTGEGADEALGGYQYFERAPSSAEASAECRRLLDHIHESDGLRVDRTAGAYGFEVRVPFLAPRFVDAVQCVPADTSLPQDATMTKSWFRQQFADFYGADVGPVMRRILWRPKNALSDAVGLNWVTDLQAFIEHDLPDSEYRRLSGLYYPGLTPTKEAVYYRRHFATLYPNHHCLDEIWMPRWHPGVTDPSARHIDSFVGDEAYASSRSIMRQ